MQGGHLSATVEEVDKRFHVVFLTCALLQCLECLTERLEIEIGLWGRHQIGDDGTDLVHVDSCADRKDLDGKNKSSETAVGEHQGAKLVNFSLTKQL